MAYPVQSDPTAVFGRRVVAALLDLALIFVPVVLLITANFEYLEVDDLRVGAAQFCDTYQEQRDGVCAEIGDRVYFTDAGNDREGLLGWAGAILLFVILQGLTGWTPGKLITGIRCVREDGRPPGILKALVRWLLWIVDGFPYFLPLVGFIVGLTTVGHRRVGDMAASTFVVGRSSAGSPIVVPGLTAPAPPAGYAGAWGAPPPDPGGATTGWGPAVDPSSSGWASPTPPVAAPPTPGTDAPQWDEARGTYIQWDSKQGAWMQWDEATRAWGRTPGQ
jgi:uncharacterized RDD family membrane protein YckC